MEGPLLQLFNLYFTKEGISDLLFKNTQSYGTLKYGTLMHILIFPLYSCFSRHKRTNRKILVGHPSWHSWFGRIYRPSCNIWCSLYY